MITKDKDDPIVRFNVPDRRNGNKAREVILRAATESDADAWFNAIEDAKSAQIEAIRAEIKEPSKNVTWLGKGLKSRKTRHTRKHKTQRKTRNRK
jgi:hypothetical protein